MKIREVALIAFGPMALMIYCGYYAYEYCSLYLFLGGIGVSLGFGAVAWGHVRKIL